MLMEIKLLAFVKFFISVLHKSNLGSFLYPNSNLVFPKIIFTVKIISNFSIF